MTSHRLTAQVGPEGLVLEYKSVEIRILCPASRGSDPCRSSWARGLWVDLSRPVPGGGALLDLGRSRRDSRVWWVSLTTVISVPCTETRSTVSLISLFVSSQTTQTASRSRWRRFVDGGVPSPDRWLWLAGVFGFASVCRLAGIFGFSGAVRFAFVLGFAGVLFVALRHEFGHFGHSVTICSVS